MTIKDLSAKTGYAVATISRVLNNHPNVSEKAREVIMQAVEESGFQLNVNAKQLKQQHATTILVVVKGTANELFSELVESIQSLVAQTQYPLVVDYRDEDEDEVLRAVQLCREKKPLGILFLGGNSQNFQANFGKIDVPCVVVTNDMSGVTDTPVVISNCTISAAGATDVHPVYVYGDSQVVITNGLKLINMPGEQLSDGYTWMGYSLSEQYSTQKDSDVDGVNDHDEIFVYGTDPFLRFRRRQSLRFN